MVDRRSHVVSIQTYGRVLRIGLHQLANWNGGIAERRRARDRAKERVGHAPQERLALGEFVDGQLVQVRVGNADVGDLGTDVSHLHGDVWCELALKRRVPLLGVAGTKIAIHGEDALPEAGRRAQRNRLDTRPTGEHKRRRDVVERALRHGL